MKKYNKQKILVIAAHPDDEVLGCGGTIARFALEGETVHVLILAEGVTARDLVRNKDKNSKKLADLKCCAQLANKLLGVSKLTLHQLPDNRMDSLNRIKIIKLIEKELLLFKPDVVFTHHAGDVNVDHRIVHEAVVTACRPIPNFCVKKLLFFEIASSTEWQPANSAPMFSPHCFVDITKTLSLKLKALRMYTDEIREFPHPRSIKGVKSLAHWRGVCCGYEAAEAFVLGREIL